MGAACAPWADAAGRGWWGRGGEGLSVGPGSLGSLARTAFLFQAKQRAALLASPFVWFLLLYERAGFGAFLVWIQEIWLGFGPKERLGSCTAELPGTLGRGMGWDGT